MVGSRARRAPGEMKPPSRATRRIRACPPPAPADGLAAGEPAGDAAGGRLAPLDEPLVAADAVHAPTSSPAVATRMAIRDKVMVDRTSGVLRPLVRGTGSLR